MKGQKMNLGAAIRNIFRALRKAMASLKEVVVDVGGRLVKMLVPSGSQTEADEPEAVNRDADEWADFGNKVRALAGQLEGDGIPSPDLMSALPQNIVRWLSVCDDSMLRSIAKSSDDEIKGHVRSRKYLRGVVCSDAQSVDHYVRALADDPDMPDDELESAYTWLPA